MARPRVGRPSVARSAGEPPGTATMAMHRLDAIYPSPLRAYFGDDAPELVFAVGNVALVGQSLLALLCSVKCPGNAILKTYDLARGLRDAGVPVVGGFHTPMEKECLELLLRGTQSIVVCPARAIEGMRIPQAIRAGIDAGRVLLLSPFAAKHRRATAQLADQRNRLVAALASQIFVAYAAPGGRTEELCREIIAKGKPLLTVDIGENSNLISLGAKPVSIDEVVNHRRRDGQD